MSIVSSDATLSIKSNNPANSLRAAFSRSSEVSAETDKAEKSEARENFRQKIGSAFSKFKAAAAAKASNAAQDFKSAYAGFMLSRLVRKEQNTIRKIEDFSQYLVGRNRSLADAAKAEPDIASSGIESSEASLSDVSAIVGANNPEETAGDNAEVISADETVHEPDIVPDETEEIAAKEPAGAGESQSPNPKSPMAVFFDEWENNYYQRQEQRVNENAPASSVEAKQRAMRNGLDHLLYTVLPAVRSYEESRNNPNIPEADRAKADADQTKYMLDLFKKVGQMASDLEGRKCYKTVSELDDKYLPDSTVEALKQKNTKSKGRDAQRAAEITDGLSGSGAGVEPSFA